MKFFHFLVLALLIPLSPHKAFSQVSAYDLVDVSDIDENVVSGGATSATRLGVNVQSGLALGGGSKYQYRNDLSLQIEQTLIGKQIGFAGFQHDLGVSFLGTKAKPFVQSCFFLMNWLCAGLRYTFGINDEFQKWGANGLSTPFQTEFTFKRGFNTSITYDPARNHTLSVGFVWHPGRRYTRDKNDSVYLPKPTDVTLQTALLENAELVKNQYQLLLDERAIEVVIESAKWVDIMLTPQVVSNELKGLNKIKQHLKSNPDQGFYYWDDRYHKALEQIFVTSLQDQTLAKEAAQRAREIILDQIIIPFNQYFGQRKRNYNLYGFNERAIRDFVQYIHNVTPFLGNRLASVEAFRQVLNGLNDIALDIKKRWGDRRFHFTNHGIYAWLPLNYGLQKEDYDQDGERVEVLGKVSGRKFTRANTVDYVINEEYFKEGLRMINETKFYQVTMIHDWRGLDNDGESDTVGWTFVADGFMNAFSNAIPEYLNGERPVLPLFYIFIDEHFYRTSKSEGIFDFMGSLSELKSVKLTDSNLQKKIDDAKIKLGAAIDQLRNAGWSEDRIKDQIRIHYTVTNPAELAHGIGAGGYWNDGVMIDHRKILFTDIFEEAPEIGSALFTGQGVGEHYGGAGWEDRTLKIRGVDLKYLKDEARQLFLGQGYKPHQVPYYLRSRSSLDYPQGFSDLEERISNLKKSKKDEAGWNTEMAMFMNRTGYRPKYASIHKAALYNMALPGSVVVGPDSIWSDDYWMSHFVSGALRGAKMIPIAPSGKNAPASGSTTLGNIHDLFAAALYISQVFKTEIDHSGGLLLPGFFNSTANAHDILQKATQVRDAVNKMPEIDQIWQFHKEATDKLTSYVNLMEQSFKAKPQVMSNPNREPKIHGKMHYFMGPNQQNVTGLPEVGELLQRYFEIRAAQNSGNNPENWSLNTDDLLYESINFLSESVNFIKKDSTNYFTLTGGSMNNNPRSMYMDGEVILTINGVESLIGLVDMAFITYSAQYPKSQTELETLLAKPNEFTDLINDLTGYLY